MNYDFLLPPRVRMLVTKIAINSLFYLFISSNLPIGKQSLDTKSTSRTSRCWGVILFIVSIYMVDFFCCSPKSEILHL